MTMPTMPTPRIAAGVFTAGDGLTVGDGLAAGGFLVAGGAAAMAMATTTPAEQATQAASISRVGDNHTRDCYGG